MPTLTNTDNAFEGTSAVSPNDLWAVGYQVEPSQVGVVMTLAEHWDGSTWRAVPTPSPSSEDSELHAVSAVTSSDVWAVGVATAQGFDDPRTLIEHWDGSAWSIVAAPSPGVGSAVLLSVTAVSSTGVWAVGYTTPTKGGNRQTLIEHWNGSSWSVSPSPSVTGSDSELLGVSGSPANGLWAVGFSLNNGRTTALVERWSGTAWSIVSGQAASETNVALTSVVSIGPSAAWAAGYLSSGTGITAFAARWDGKTWTKATLPQPGTTVATLRGVVADSQGHVTAVGTYYNAALQNSADHYSGFSEYWDGSVWVEVTSTPELRAATAVPGTSRVWAVGTGGAFPVSLAVAQRTCNIPATAGPLPAGGAATPSTPIRSQAASTPIASEVQPAGDPTARDIASPAGIAQTLKTYSAAVADFNSDGNQDFFLVDHLTVGQLWLSDGQAHFSQADVGTFYQSDRHTCLAGAVNSDALPDIFCTVGAAHGNGMKSDELWIQGAGTTFTDKTASRGVIDPFGRGRQATFIDANGDGRPDIFLGNQMFRGDGLPSPNRLFLNTGTGFVDAPGFGLDQDIGSVCAESADYNGDGRADLLVCPDSGPLKLYQNVGGTSFADVTASAGLTIAQPLAARFADLNGDGRLDLVVVTANRLRVLLQNPDHTFTQSVGLPLTAGSNVAVGDVNGDGHPDIYAVQGALSGINQPDMMLINNGTGTNFTPVAVPETTTGNGDNAYPIDAEHNGLTDFLVLNGKDPALGPMQLIAFFPTTPTPSPLPERGTGKGSSG